MAYEGVKFRLLGLEKTKKFDVENGRPLCVTLIEIKYTASFASRLSTVDKVESCFSLLVSIEKSGKI